MTPLREEEAGEQGEEGGDEDEEEEEEEEEDIPFAVMVEAKTTGYFLESGMGFYTQFTLDQVEQFDVS
jgi:hypothetical protein